MSKSNAVGRPTKYREEMCEKVLHLFKDGLTQVEVATALGITYETYSVWQHTIPEFSDAVKKGLQLSKTWWMKTGREGLKNKNFSFVGWSMQVKNMFRHYTDEQPVNLPELAQAITFTDKINVIIKAISKGHITTSEAKKLSEVIAIGAKVEESTELKQRIEELEELLPQREDN